MADKLLAHLRSPASFRSSGKGTFIGGFRNDPETSRIPSSPRWVPTTFPSGLNPANDTAARSAHNYSVQPTDEHEVTTAESLMTTVDFFEQFSMGVSFPWDSSPCDINDTLCEFNVSTGADSSSGTTLENRYWATILIIFPLFTVFGNTLVVMSVVKERSLKTATNYFICSLAVADIMVAIVVMPFAVYLEVVGEWWLSDILCDAWVASDVMACTSSILNLTAISVDRFIAVTQPIKYSKHKNSKRVFLMIAMTWAISIAIAAPIALGVNYSDKRVPGKCSFFNSDFLIYSSMGSFYIPSLIMIFLYWRIYRVLRLRATKAMKAKKIKTVDKKALQSVIENTQATGGAAATAHEPTVTTGLARMDNGKASYNTNTSHKLVPPFVDDTSVTNIPSASSSHDNEEDTPPPNGGSDPTRSQPPSDEGGPHHHHPAHVYDAGNEIIVNPVAEAVERQEAEEGKRLASAGVGQSSLPGAEAETPFNSPGAASKETNSVKRKSALLKKAAGSKNKDDKKGVTKFNFHMRTSRKRKERSSSRKERKATKTLAIVLGVFLLCWWPFFTMNIISAICIRYDLESHPACDMDPLILGILVWLGYINSFLNPVIYTIFNPEFRKAFRRLLMEPCK